MMQTVYLFIIKLIVIKLRMVVGLHKASAGEIIYHGRYTCDRHGKIIRPGLDRRCHCRLFRISYRQIRQIRQIFLQEADIFIAAADPRSGTMCQRRKFKIQICNYLPYPLRMCGKYLLISSRRPVEIGIHHAPFLGCHGTDHNGIVRLETTVLQRLCNTKHQSDRCIVILESVKIGIVVCRQKHHAVRMFSGNLSHNIISRAVSCHPGFRIKGDCYFLLITQQLQQACRIFSGNGKSGSILRSGNILCIQSFIVDFAVATALHCDQGCGSLQMCLVYRIIDPPLISLVNLHQYQLIPDIFSLIVRLRSFSQVHHGKFLGTIGDKGCLISSQFC